jgi:hypothetical protein
VCRSECAIHLYRVTVLNNRFPVLTFCKVTLATVKVLLLANVGVTRAAGQKRGRKTKHNYKAEKRGLHFKFSSGAFLRLESIVLD